jgi:hypothetical protein
MPEFSVYTSQLNNFGPGFVNSRLFMRLSRTRSIIVIVAFLTLATCVDPYFPVLKGYGPMLVVNGLVTDSKDYYTVQLSTSFQDKNNKLPEIKYATVYISDDIGEKNYLYYSGNGIYVSDSTHFRGVPGRTYVLHIITPDGREYASDSCLMQTAADIDSIYYEKDEELFNNGTERQKGVRIYADSKSGGDSHYYRWGYEETWKFKVPYPKRYDYVIPNQIIPAALVNEYCWKSKKSDAVVINSVYGGQNGRIERQPISFIASARSDRLMLEYSMLVKQYSISEKEFEFWKNLKTVDESGGDIFGSQPYPVVSNIHCITDPNERVLGYFQVSAVKEKRIFIPFSAVIELSLPFYHEDQCARIEAGREVFLDGSVGTFDMVYSDYCITSHYVFIEPVFSAAGLDKLAFTTPECADCAVTGTPVKPDFWVDMN